MKKPVVFDPVTTAVVATGTVTPRYEVTGLEAATIASVITVDANAAGTFVGATANAVTITAHGYKTGLVGQVSNSGGALPTGLSGSTNYYIIAIDANTVKFASSQVNALAGTAITITGGTGTNTFTATALAGLTVQAQWSVDGTTYFGLGSPISIATSTNVGFPYDGPEFKYYQLVFAITSGSATVVTTNMTTYINGTR